MNSGKADQPSTTGDQNSQLKQFFRRSLSTWKEFYDRTDLYARIYQERRATAVAFIDEPDCPRDRLRWMWMRTGLTTVALARKGYMVHAMDFLPEMASATRSPVWKTGSTRVSTSIGNAAAPVYNNVFDLSLLLAYGMDAFSSRSLKESVRVLARWSYCDRIR